MRQRGKFRFVGYNQTGGRPRDVYCNGWWPNKLEHELKLTKALLAILMAEPLLVRRGPHVDQRYRADAELFFPGGDIWRVEMDTGTQNFSQIEARWKVYRACPDLVLVVTCRKAIDGLLERTKPYAECLHVARHADVLSDPWGDIMTDARGERFSLALSLKGTDEQ